MKRLGPVARRYVDQYPERKPTLDEAARQMKALLKDTLVSAALNLHSVRARAKGYESAVRKIIRKGYGRPSQRMTDAIAARIITYYKSDVDIAVQSIRDRFDIHPQKSIDKSTFLGLREFGYKTVHLVVKVRAGDATRFPLLKGRWMEVQVRSLLEHSWAEIEHEIVYKSGVDFPPETLRRFSALAAIIETMDTAFGGLRVEELALREEYAGMFRAGDGLDEKLDAARLVALMDALYPLNPGWHRAGTSAAIVPGMAARLRDAMTLSGTGTPREVATLLNRADVKSWTAAYAAATGRALDEVSHVTLLLLALASKDQGVLEDCFPGECQDPFLIDALSA